MIFDNPAPCEAITILAFWNKVIDSWVVNLSESNIIKFPNFSVKNCKHWSKLDIDLSKLFFL